MINAYIEEEFRGSEDVLHEPREDILGVGYMKNGTTPEKFREMYPFKCCMCSQSL